MEVQNRIHTFPEVRFAVSDLRTRPEPRRVLLCSPEFFTVRDSKNIHMKPGTEVDTALACAQWEKLHDCLVKLREQNQIDEVAVITGEPDCEDMVFCANPSLPWLDESGGKTVFLSLMRHPRRQREVVFFEKFYTRREYRTLRSETGAIFEGMGDAIPHPGRRVLYGGHGFRSELPAYEEIARLLEVPVLPLRLVDERFYHLDTCFLPLDENTVLFLPAAFDEQSRKLIEQMFETVIHAPSKEAAHNFALNALLLSGADGQKSALIQTGNPETMAILRENDFIVYEINTSEFLKSGGSIFCMKMMWY